MANAKKFAMQPKFRICNLHKLRIFFSRCYAFAFLYHYTTIFFSCSTSNVFRTVKNVLKSAISKLTSGISWFTLSILLFVTQSFNGSKQIFFGLQEASMFCQRYYLSHLLLLLGLQIRLTYNEVLNRRSLR